MIYFLITGCEICETDVSIAHRWSPSEVCLPGWNLGNAFRQNTKPIGIMDTSKTTISFRFKNVSQNCGLKDSSRMGGWTPNTDICEMDNSLQVRMELAGVRPEQIQLAADAQRLIIKGYREDPWRNLNCACRHFRMMEVYFGDFECVLTLPDAFDCSNATADYTNGFLILTIPHTTSA